MKSFFSKPKLVTAIAVVIAVIIAIFSFNTTKKAVNSLPFADTTSNSTTTAVAPNQDLTLAFASAGKIAQVNVHVGEKVAKGQVLASLDAQSALGTVNQAKSAYTSAQTNLTQVQKQQDILVANAYRTLLSDHLEAVPSNINTQASAPTISGNYNSQEQGSYVVRVYGSSANSGESFDISGLETGFTSEVTPNVAIPLGSRGLFIQFSNSLLYANTTWTITIPNTRSTFYTANKNAYDAAVASHDTAIAAAQAQVQNTLGALQITEGNYNNTLITAPASGTITNVSITPGQLASVNTPAIELLTATK